MDTRVRCQLNSNLLCQRFIRARKVVAVYSGLQLISQNRDEVVENRRKRLCQQIGAAVRKIVFRVLAPVGCLGPVFPFP